MLRLSAGFVILESICLGACTDVNTNCNLTAKWNKIASQSGCWQEWGSYSFFKLDLGSKWHYQHYFTTIYNFSPRSVCLLIYIYFFLLGVQSLMHASSKHSQHSWTHVKKNRKVKYIRSSWLQKLSWIKLQPFDTSVLDVFELLIQKKKFLLFRLNCRIVSRLRLNRVLIILSD